MDLNIVYYTINILSHIKDMTIIVTKFVKFRSNCLLAVMFVSGGIFQAKSDEILSNIEGLKPYSGYILVLINGDFTKYIDQLRLISAMLSSSVLKVKTTMCGVCLKYITYLCYVIIRDGIKFDRNNVQGIMYLVRNTNTTEVQVLIGIV